MNNSGFVARLTKSLSSIDDIEFLTEKDGYVKMFKSRGDALIYLRTVEHLSDDDLRFILWLEHSGENYFFILTGEYYYGFQTILGFQIAMNFWKCDMCGQIFRTITTPECIFCGFVARYNVSVNEIRDSILLSDFERSMLIKFDQESASG